MVEEGTALVLLRELVAAEPLGPSSGEDDAGDAIGVGVRRDRLDSARRRTRSVP
jgi:hypothetical protein